MRLSIGAILIVTVPETIIKSEWRGDAHGTMPKRSTSKRDANVAIISIAQQASRNRRPRPGWQRSEPVDMQTNASSVQNQPENKVYHRVQTTTRKPRRLPITCAMPLGRRLP